MKEVEKKKVSNTNETKHFRKTERGNNNLNQENSGKKLNGRRAEPKASMSRQHPAALVSDPKMGGERSKVYGNMVMPYVDDVNRSGEGSRGPKFDSMIKQSDGEVSEGHSSDLDKEPEEGIEEESDSETLRESISSQGDSVTAEDEKVERGSQNSEGTPKTSSSRSHPYGSRVRSDGSRSRSRPNAEVNSPKAFPRYNGGQSKVFNANSSHKNSKNVKFPPKPLSESSKGVDDKTVEEVKEIDVLGDVSNGSPSVVSDMETSDAEEHGAVEDKVPLARNDEEMDKKIESLEQELRAVAALEISLYSVVPQHENSSHKLHAPARQLSRLYILAFKCWTPEKQATIAKNTVSGLLLIGKSCGSDVPRLTFWLSNTIVLREVISQTLDSSQNSSCSAKSVESNDIKPTSLKWKGSCGSNDVNQHIHFDGHWQETQTFTTALERVESWIFSRIVESVWLQTMTPRMQSPVKDTMSQKSMGWLLRAALSEQKQGSFSVNLWRNAFQDASQQLCPVRAVRHECGCLPVIARMVMQHCVARLDVAMFNAILRESAHQIPTDPISDPIGDSRVLPIPPGDLSFGSGAQLKNAVGNWSRSLTDTFGMDAEDYIKEDQDGNEKDVLQDGQEEQKSFLLLNSLSDLLMLPKDMLMDQSIRNKVCPSLSLPIILRVLCNFSPDEFCPDPVPCEALEALNDEVSAERRLLGDSARSFPCKAAPVVYAPPSAAEVPEAGGISHFLRTASEVQSNGYTSNEDLEELESPVASIIDKLLPYLEVIANGNGHAGKEPTNNSSVIRRYELLHEIWSGI